MRARSPRLALAASLIALALAPACATLQPPPPFGAPEPELHGDVAELGWLIGRWTTDADDVEDDWFPAGDALFCASFQVDGTRTSSFAVRIVARDEHDRLVLREMTDGATPISFVRTASADRAIRFTNPSNPFPKTISMARRDAGQVSRLGLRLAGARPNLDRPMLLIPSERAPELERADLAFAADVDARGTDGWVEAFDAQGGMESEGRRIEGAAAIRDAMEPLLADRSRRLQWAPSWSGLSPAGDVGFTIGAWALRNHADGAWQTVATGSYATMWRRQPDGTWKVLFDAGDDDAPLAASEPGAAAP